MLTELYFMESSCNVQCCCILMKDIIQHPQIKINITGVYNNTVTARVSIPGKNALNLFSYCTCVMTVFVKYILYMWLVMCTAVLLNVKLINFYMYYYCGTTHCMYNTVDYIDTSRNTILIVNCWTCTCSSHNRLFPTIVTFWLFLTHPKLYL